MAEDARAAFRTQGETVDSLSVQRDGLAQGGQFVFPGPEVPGDPAFFFARAGGKQQDAVHGAVSVVII